MTGELVRNTKRGGANKIVWTPEMDDALRGLRAAGVPLYECAERIGVVYDTANRRARELGCAGRMSRGRTPGAVAIKKEPRT